MLIGHRTIAAVLTSHPQGLAFLGVGDLSICLLPRELLALRENERLPDIRVVWLKQISGILSLAQPSPQVEHVVASKDSAPDESYSRFLSIELVDVFAWVRVGVRTGKKVSEGRYEGYAPVAALRRDPASNVCLSPNITSPRASVSS